MELLHAARPAALARLPSYRQPATQLGYCSTATLQHAGDATAAAAALLRATWLALLGLSPPAGVVVDALPVLRVRPAVPVGRAVPGRPRHLHVVHGEAGLE